MGATMDILNAARIPWSEAITKLEMSFSVACNKLYKNELISLQKEVCLKTSLLKYGFSILDIDNVDYNEVVHGFYILLQLY